MSDTQVAATSEYWWAITNNEAFIRQYGHNAFPAWEDKEHPDLMQAYERVEPFLKSISRKRMFYGLPGELNPFPAANYHDALVLFLNPPERWFGNIGVLTSPEYLALKRRVVEEESAIAHSLAVEASTSSPLDGLSDTVLTILQAIDMKSPFTWDEIATKSGYTHDLVRRYSRRLQEAHLIKKIDRRGFVRLIELPSDCDRL